MAFREQGTTAAVLNEFFRGRMLETHTALPGVVQSFDASKQEADIKIPLRRVRVGPDGNEVEYEWPPLTGVPVWMPHAGGFSITMPVAVGDECLVVFLERDVSLWLEDAGTHPPDSARVHDLSDGVALVGLSTQPNKVASYDGTDMQIRSPVAGNEITIGADGSIDITGKDIAIGDGTDELLSLIEDLFVALDAALVTDPVSGDQPLTAATKAALAVVKAKFTAMKP